MSLKLILELAHLAHTTIKFVESMTKEKHSHPPNPISRDQHQEVALEDGVDLDVKASAVKPRVYENPTATRMIRGKARKESATGTARKSSAAAKSARNGSVNQESTTKKTSKKSTSAKKMSPSKGTQRKVTTPTKSAIRKAPSLKKAAKK